jgi:5'-3' exonuclease
MIIIDMNQIMISNLMTQIKKRHLDDNLVRHLILKSLERYEREYEDEYGEVVLAYDSKHYWRKEFFPYYKWSRKKDRQKSGLNWNSIFDLLNLIKDEIKEHFHYKVVEVDGAEADDVIAVLCKHKNPKERILILSGDKDFIQLHRYPGVVQYNPVTKRYVTSENPWTYIRQHVIKGDKSDGIPNFLSSDDTFVKGVRQRPISQKKLNVWVKQDPSMFCKTEEEYNNYCRNLQLIDADYIPENIQDKILDTYHKLNKIEKTIPLEYFRKHQLNQFMNRLHESTINVAMKK